MVFQKNHNGRSVTYESPLKSARQSVAGFFHDLISLTQLQFQLLLADVQEAGSGMRTPIVAWIVAGLLTIGAMPVLLFGIAWYLGDATRLSHGGALLATAVGFLVIAAGLLWWGAKKFSASAKLLSRSQHELSENVLWVKRALKTQYADQE